MSEELELLERAIRNCKHGPQPNRSLSGYVEHGGETYAVLRNVNGVLGVYREGRGRLMRLTNIPRWAADEEA